MRSPFRNNEVNVNMGDEHQGFLNNYWRNFLEGNTIVNAQDNSVQDHTASTNSSLVYVREACPPSYLSPHDAASTNSSLVYVTESCPPSILSPSDAASTNSSLVYVTESCPHPSSSDTDAETTSKRWSNAEVLLLIDCYALRREKFKDINMKNKVIWEEISKELARKGYRRDVTSCETKMKNLKRSYTQCIDHNSGSGNERKKCSFFDQLESLFGKDHAMQPPVVCSNIDGTAVASRASVESSSDGEEGKQKLTRKRKATKKPKKQEEDLVSLFKEFTKDRKEDEENKIKKMETMHNERMTVMNRFLDVFEKSVKKD